MSKEIYDRFTDADYESKGRRYPTEAEWAAAHADEQAVVEKLKAHEQELAQRKAEDMKAYEQYAAEEARGYEQIFWEQAYIEAMRASLTVPPHEYDARLCAAAADQACAERAKRLK